MILVTTVAASPQSAPLARADRYFAGEHYHEAIIEYLNVLRIDPTNIRALRNTGLAHFELGQQGKTSRAVL